MAKHAYKPIDFESPVRGIYKGSDWHNFPKGFTPDALNVLPFDSQLRNRPCKRPGTSKYWSMQFGPTSPATWIQHLSWATVQNTGAGTSNAYIIVVCGGRTYRQLPGDVSVTRIDGGVTAFSAGRQVSGFTLFNKTYLTDGLTNKVYDHGAGSWGSWTASAGSFPTAGGEFCRGVCAWRGRAVLVHLDKGIASTIFFSAMGDPTDFDYGATASPTMAVATDDNFRAGQLGEPVTALVPAGNDILYVGCVSSIHAFRGDPADGGTLVPVSTSVGMLSEYAWCMVASTIYFLGTGGLYKLAPGGEPILISHYAIDGTYRDLPQIGNYTSMAYDKQLHGVWIFVTHAAAVVVNGVDTFPTRHLYYDLRAEELYQVGGFWPIEFPIDSGGENNAGGNTAPTHGPTKAMTFDGFDATNDARVVLIGGRDGYVRQFDDAALNDDGTAITSYVYSSFLQPAGAVDDAIMQGWQPIAAEISSFNATWTLQAGPDPYSCYNAPTTTKSGTFTSGGRQPPRGERMAGNTFLFKQSNSTASKTHAMERITIKVAAAGPTR